METKTPNNVPKEISKYMSALGKKGGATNKKKGSAYFRWVRSKNKKRPVKLLDGNAPATEGLRDSDEPRCCQSSNDSVRNTNSLNRKDSGNCTD